MKIFTKSFWKRRLGIAAGAAPTSTLATAKTMNPTAIAKPSAVPAAKPATAPAGIGKLPLASKFEAITDPAERTAFLLKHGSQMREESALAEGYTKQPGGAFSPPPKPEANDYPAGPFRLVDLSAQSPAAQSAFARLYAMALEFDGIRSGLVRQLWTLQHRDEIYRLQREETALGAHWFKVFELV